ncbi:MAG: DUF2191 domain-containing protein [Acidobacteria bacterium]|nr:DUF2191 domain-containing protein [Acidobacteriota bacterium]
MKTTVEIADTLLTAARRVAAKEGTTVRALIEEGLRKVVDKRAQRGGFKLRRVTFGGKGLAADLSHDDWNAIRDRAYEGRGGR